MHSIVARNSRSHFRWPLIVLAAWLALVAVAVAIRPVGTVGSLCLFRNISGVPCPTCGSTRAVAALSHGQLNEAFRLNPLVVSAVLFALIWIPARLTLKRQVVPAASSSTKRALLTCAAVLFILNWIWVLTFDR